MEQAAKTKKPRKMSGTPKQRKALAILAEGGRSVSAAMREAGYSPSTATKPDKLTRSAGYQELIAQYLPEEKVLERHKELLDKKEILVVSDGAKLGSHLENTGQPHSDAKWAIDAFYKLKGYTKEGVTNNVLIVQLSDSAAARYQVSPDEA